MPVEMRTAKRWQQPFLTVPETAMAERAGMAAEIEESCASSTPVLLHKRCRGANF